MDHLASGSSIFAWSYRLLSHPSRLQTQVISARLHIDLAPHGLSDTGLDWYDC